MNVLVLNCGSSSVKFQLISTDLERIEQDADRRLAHGLIERVGGAGIVTFTAEGNAPKRFAEPIRDTRAAVRSRRPMSFMSRIVLCLWTGQECASMKLAHPRKVPCT